MLTQSSALLAVALGCLVAVVSTAQVPTYVRVKLLEFQYTGKGCDPFENKCDPKFKLDYSYLGQSESQSIGEHTNSHTIIFSEIPKVFTGPFPVGSEITINIEVEDNDIGGTTDHMASFRFHYLIPAVQGEDLRVSHRDGQSRFDIEFRTIFMDSQ